MPTAYVTKMATKHGTSAEEMEEKWNNAKKVIGPDTSAPGYWAKVMTVFKNMIGEEEMVGFEDFIDVGS